jgi:hypothetical protein
VFTRASSQYLTLPDNTFPIGSSSFSIFFVFTPTSTAYEIQLITAGARGGSIFGIRSGNAGTGTLQTFWSGANDLQTSNLWAVKQRNIGTLLYQTSGARSLWINGVQGASETGAGSTITTSNRIGTLEPGAFNTFDGQFHEVLVFESSLSATERQQVEAYLAQKWDPVPSPLSIPGCVFWLDAGDRSTLTLSSSNTITAWTEKSGANRTVTTNSTGIYSATAMNGRPGIQFSAGNVMTSSTASTLGNNLTAFVVFMATSEGPRQLNVPIFVGSSANGYWLTYRGDFQIYAARQEGGAQAGNSYYRNINIPIIMAGVASATLSQQTAFLNGYSTDVVNAAPLSNVGGTTIYIPGGEPYWGGPANGMFNGVISEVLLFSNALTTTQRQTVEGYLSSKWGIPIRVKPPVLPATHAFPLASPALRDFSPLDIDGLAIWLDSADSASYRLSGSNVTQFNDKQGLITLTASSAFATVGTQPGFTFASNTSTYTATTTITPAAFTTSSTDFTLAIIANHTTEGIVNALPFNIGISGPRLCPFFSYDGTAGRVSTFADCAAPADPRLGAGNSIVSGSPSVVIYRRSGSTVTLRIAGATAASNTFSSPASFASSNYTVTMSPGGAKWWGTLYEVLHYSAALSDVDVVRLEGYIADKWGLRGSMGGVSHPYRFGPAAVLPTQIPGCTLWLDAADATTLTLSGSNVTAWTNKSGTASLTLFGTAPTYVSNQVRFNSSGRFQGAYTMTTQTTMFAVYSTTNTTTNARLVTGDGSNGYGNVHAPVGTDNDLFVYTGGGPGYYTTLTPQTGLRMYTIGFNGSNTAVWRNGSAATMAGTAANATATGANIAIGASVNGDNPWIGELSELIFFNTALTTTQRQQVEGYLAWKWGLQANLASTTTPWLQLKRALAPVFTPTQIPGCSLWLDAADATTVTLSGSNITQWNDKSGRGYHAVAVGTPTIQSLCNSTYRGVLCSATSAFGYSNATAMNSGQVLTTFAVAHLSGTGDFVRLLGFATEATLDDGTGGAIPFCRRIGENSVTIVRNGVVGTAAVPITQGLLFQGASVIGPTSAIQYINGQSNSAISYTNATFNYTRYGVGQNGRGTGERWPGVICEVITYDALLTDSQRQRIEGYLAEKWGLRGSLGGLNHPSRFGPPVILPTQISGCVLWLDAADAAVFNGGATWTDKSGTGNHGINGTPGSSTMPTVTTWTNGLTAARFVSASKNSIKTTNVIPTLNITYYFVVRITGLGSGKQALMINNVDGKRQIYTEATSFPAQVVALAAPATPATNVISVAQSVPFIYGATFSGGFNLYVNGTDLGASPLSDSVASRHYFGSGDGDGAYLSCDFAEILIYSTVLTTAQRQQIEGYLAWKWGLQQTLPSSTHPYKTIKP